jgi:hypothetical protein
MIQLKFAKEVLLPEKLKAIKKICIPQQKRVNLVLRFSPNYTKIR